MSDYDDAGIEQFTSNLGHAPQAMRRPPTPSSPFATFMGDWPIGEARAAPRGVREASRAPLDRKRSIIPIPANTFCCHLEVT